MSNTDKRTTIVNGIILAMLLLFSHAAMADQTFVGGMVQEFSHSSLRIDAETYKVDPKVRVLLHEKRGAAITEQRGTRSDVQPGSRATVKLDAGIVTLIYVELYH